MAVDAETGKPTPKPGVTVTIGYKCQSNWYDWAVTLDGSGEDAFYLYACRDDEGNRFPTPEDAEADCEARVAEFISRATLIPVGAFDLKLTFVREQR